MKGYPDLVAMVEQMNYDSTKMIIIMAAITGLAALVLSRFEASKFENLVKISDFPVEL